MRFNSNSFSDGGLEETKLEVPPDCTGDGTSRTNHPFSSLKNNQIHCNPKKDINDGGCHTLPLLWPHAQKEAFLLIMRPF